MAMDEPFGPEYLLNFFNNYTGRMDVSTDANNNFKAFLMNFQELNAHSVYHLLEHIEVSCTTWLSVVLVVLVVLVHVRCMFGVPPV